MFSWCFAYRQLLWIPNDWNNLFIMNIIWCGNINRAWTVMTEIQTWTKPTKSIQFTFYTTQHNTLLLLLLLFVHFISFQFSSFRCSFYSVLLLLLLLLTISKYLHASERLVHGAIHILYSTLLYERTNEWANQRTNIFNNNSNSNSYISVCVCCMLYVFGFTL